MGQKKSNEKKPDVSVVVPVYNSEQSLPELYRRLGETFERLSLSWELILVNDCSKDSSWHVAESLTHTHHNVIAINLMNNFGQHNAIMCGFHYAVGEYLVTMDDDLQHPPEEVSKLWNTIRSKNYLLVYGQYEQKRHGWFRDFCSKTVNKILSRITGSGYGVTSFRIVRREVIEKITRHNQYNVMIDVLLKETVASSFVGHCGVEHHPRTLGKSNYSFRKLFWYALNMVFSYTLWPLRLATVLGFFFALLGIAGGILLLIYYFKQGVAVSGWTSLILAVVFFSGIILFMMGVIGEYVGRIFLNINQKPQFVVKDVIDRR